MNFAYLYASYSRWRIFIEMMTSKVIQIKVIMLIFVKSCISAIQNNPSTFCEGLSLLEKDLLLYLLGPFCLISIPCHVQNKLLFYLCFIV